MNVVMYEQDNGKCPYLPNRQWRTRFFYSQDIDSALYESLLASGWRRNSFVFYCNQCENCQECLPIRIDALKFTPSKSQRRVLRRNEDLRYTIDNSIFRDEDFKLFQRYSHQWHQSEEVFDETQYMHFIFSPIETKMLRYWLDDTLIGIGWIDLLENSLSSIYFAFEPSYADRRLGTFSLLKELELCRDMNKEWLQLGFLVKDCRKMNYKANFKPYQISVNGSWQTPDDADSKATE